MSHILFVNKNSHEVLPLMEYAECKGFKVSAVNNLQDALTVTAAENPDAVIADIHLVDGSGLDLLRNRSCPLTDETKIFITGDLVDKKSANEARELGAHDYFDRPLTIENLNRIFNSVKTGSAMLVDDEPNPDGFGEMVGRSTAMQNLYQVIQRVAPTTATVFIIGKSGTGKELVAQAVHNNSLRAKKKYLAINCGAISSELIGSALFGHEKGSFTGAVQSHKGYFEQASGGTLFLDEITETSPDLQVKLLRVLETGKVIPVGGKRQIDVDVRIIASTNRDLRLAVKQGVLREDLYYRLNVFPIHLTLLKERGEDVILLAKYFLNTYNHLENRDVSFNDAALNAIRNLDYPGNVRELKNLIHRAFILADDIIDAAHIQAHKDLAPIEDLLENIQIPLGTSLQEAEEQFIKGTLKHYSNNLKLVAQVLDISQKQLLYKLNIKNQQLEKIKA